MYKKTKKLICEYLESTKNDFDGWDWPILCGQEKQQLNCYPHEEEKFSSDVLKDAQAYEDMVNESVAFCERKVSYACNYIENDNIDSALTELCMALDEEKLYKNNDEECVYYAAIEMFKQILSFGDMTSKDLHSFVDSFTQLHYFQV